MEVRRRRLHKGRMGLISCMESNQLGLIEQQGLIIQLGLVDQLGLLERLDPMEQMSLIEQLSKKHAGLMERKTTQPGWLLTAG